MLHTEEDDLVLFEDQMEFLRALLLAEEVSCDSSRLDVALQLVESTRRRFAHPAGGFGDIAHDQSGIGELTSPRRSLMANSKWAHSMSLLGIATGKTELIEEAKSILGSFDLETVLAHGPFASAYWSAAKTLKAGPVKVDIHSSSDERPFDNDLWLASKRALNPGVITTLNSDSSDFAVICSDSGCSEKVTEPSCLFNRLRARCAGQV
jgi:uncharacterized protein YyaL (SSP411 family)